MWKSFVFEVYDWESEPSCQRVEDDTTRQTASVCALCRGRGCYKQGHIIINRVNRRSPLHIVERGVLEDPIYELVPYVQGRTTKTIKKVIPNEALHLPSSINLNKLYNLPTGDSELCRGTCRQKSLGYLWILRPVL